jgi:hypothetical protein
MREKQPTQPALVHLERERNRLLATRQKQLEAFVEEASGGKRRRMAQLFMKIRQTNDFLRTLGDIAESLKPVEPDAKPRYAVSSLFLYESFKKLTADRDEQFFFVTGTELGGALILDQWAEFGRLYTCVIRGLGVELEYGSCLRTNHTSGSHRLFF